MGLAKQALYAAVVHSKGRATVKGLGETREKAIAIAKTYYSNAKKIPEFHVVLLTLAQTEKALVGQDDLHKLGVL